MMSEVFQINNQEKISLYFLNGLWVVRIDDTVNNHWYIFLQKRNEDYSKEFFNNLTDLYK